MLTMLQKDLGDLSHLTLARDRFRSFLDYGVLYHVTTIHYFMFSYNSFSEVDIVVVLPKHTHTQNQCITYSTNTPVQNNGANSWVLLNI